MRLGCSTGFFWFALFSLSYLVTYVSAFSLQAKKLTDYESMCSSTWYHMETSLNIPKISSRGFERDIQKEICVDKSFSCCTKNIEDLLVKEAREHYHDILIRQNIGVLKTEFIDYSSKFDPIIQSILSKSQREFERIFNHSYAIQFKRNNKVFAQFFSSLQDFYREYPVDINKAIKDLFVEITILMFDFLKTDESLLINKDCVSENFDSIKPFGSSIANNIEAKLIESIESVKMFTLGITKIRDMILELFSRFENPSEKCTRMLTKINQCPMCAPADNEFVQEVPVIKPCINSCIHVYSKCIGIDLDKLNPIWNKYLDLMKKFSWHIEYSINFENSINQLKFQISDAIMYFKSNSNVIMGNLRRRCPSNNAYSLNSMLMKRQVKSPRYFHSTDRLPEFDVRSDLSQAKLHSFFIELNRYFYNLNGYWSVLIPNVCKSISAHHEKCWNGTHLTSTSTNDIDEAAFMLDDNSKHQSIKLRFKYQKFNRTFHRQLLSLNHFNEKLQKRLDVNRFDEIFNTPLVRNFKNMNAYNVNSERKPENYVETTTTTTTTKSATAPIVVIESKVIQHNNINDQYEDDEDDYYYNDYYGKDIYNYEDDYQFDSVKSTKTYASIFYNNTMPSLTTTTTVKSFVFFKEVAMDMFKENMEPRLIDEYDIDKNYNGYQNQNKYDYYYEDYDDYSEDGEQEVKTTKISTVKESTVSSAGDGVVNEESSKTERNFKKLKHYFISYYDSKANGACTESVGLLIAIVNVAICLFFL